MLSGFVQVSRVGLNEKEIEAAGIQHETWTRNLADVDRCKCDGLESGFVKISVRKVIALVPIALNRDCSNMTELIESIGLFVTCCCVFLAVFTRKLIKFWAPQSWAPTRET